MADLITAAYMRGLARGMFPRVEADHDRLDALAAAMGDEAEHLRQVTAAEIPVPYAKLKVWARVLGIETLDLQQDIRGRVTPGLHRADVDDDRLLDTARMIAVANRTAAGEPCDYPAWSSITGAEGRCYVDAPAEIAGMKSVFAFVVDGDSMTPGFEDGDLVFARELQHGEGYKDGSACCVALYDDRTTFKQVWHDLDVGAVELRPINESHRSIRVPANEVVGTGLVVTLIKAWESTSVAFAGRG